MIKKSNKFNFTLQHHIYPKDLHRGTKLMAQNITGENVAFNNYQ